MSAPPWSPGAGHRSGGGFQQSFPQTWWISSRTPGCASCLEVVEVGVVLGALALVVRLEACLARVLFRRDAARRLRGRHLLRDGNCLRHERRQRGKTGTMSAHLSRSFSVRASHRGGSRLTADERGTG